MSQRLSISKIEIRKLLPQQLSSNKCDEHQNANRKSALTSRAAANNGKTTQDRQAGHNADEQPFADAKDRRRLRRRREKEVINEQERATAHHSKPDFYASCIHAGSSGLATSAATLVPWRWDAT